MKHSQVILLEIAAAEAVLYFAVLMVSRYALEGTFPRWYYIAVSAVFWAVLGIITHKLEFWSYSSKRRALVTIAGLDIVCYILIFAGWIIAFPERGITASQLWPLALILAIEYLLYRSWYYHFRRVPYFYVDPNIQSSEPVKERGIENAAHYLNNETKNPDLERIYRETQKLNHAEHLEWVKAHSPEFAPDTLILEQGTIPAGIGPKSLIVCLQRFNDIRHFNLFLADANRVLADGGTLSMCGETSGMRRSRLLASNPPVIGRFAEVADYLLTRVAPKLSITRKPYMKISRGQDRNYPRVEVLGRIARAGFAICGDEIRENYYYITATKVKAPIQNQPYYGPVIRLPRKGKGGKNIGVFKLRSMYAYAEYIQDYTYKINGLEKGGKLKDDFRVNLLGSICRSRFIDELPMFINLFKRDLKLVGVRPLSKQYLSLYTPEMQELHLSVKPGIFPPLYYDYPKPSTIEEIQESERRYIERYNEHPFRTDWVYFWGMMRNILFKRERSH